MATRDVCSSIIEQALEQKRSVLLLDDAQRVCEAHKISTPESGVAVTVQDAAQKANEIGYPVALKILSAEIIHKTEIGGVVLNVGSEKELTVQYDRLIARITSRDPLAMIRGVLVERMMPPSTEVIVGGLRDRQFGPTVMFGIGGIFAEVYDDVTFRIAPIDRVDALNMVNGLRGSRILEGVRGQAPLDLDAVVNVLLAASGMMCQHAAIAQLDLNPVILYSNGSCAVDSRIILTGEERR